MEGRRSTGTCPDAGAVRQTTARPPASTTVATAAPQISRRRAIPCAAFRRAARTKRRLDDRRSGAASRARSMTRASGRGTSDRTARRPAREPASCAARISCEFPLHGIRAAEQVKEQHAQAVDVALSRGRTVRRALPAPHTAACPSDRTPTRSSSSRPVAEVHQHDTAIVAEHDVVRLDVAMKQSRGMDGLRRRCRDRRRFAPLRPALNGAPSASICSSVRPRTSSIHRPMRSPICSAP